MPKPIWFPFYPNDFLSSSTVTLMTNEERGGYLLLLCHEWNDPQCSLPDDDAAVRKLSQLMGDLTLVKSCFIRKRGRLFNERLYKEWIKVKEKSELAKHSSEIRWTSERNANVMRTDNRTLSSSHRNIGTSESSQKNKGIEEQSHSDKELCIVSEFETFWTHYPKKVGRKEALRAWDKAKDRPVLVDIIQVIETSKTSEQWLKDNGQFIPNPSTWINQGRWADEPTQKPITTLEAFLNRKDHDEPLRIR